MRDETKLRTVSYGQVRDKLFEYFAKHGNITYAQCRQLMLGEGLRPVAEATYKRHHDSYILDNGPFPTASATDPPRAVPVLVTTDSDDIDQAIIAILDTHGTGITYKRFCELITGLGCNPCDDERFNGRRREYIRKKTGQPVEPSPLLLPPDPPPLATEEAKDDVVPGYEPSKRCDSGMSLLEKLERMPGIIRFASAVDAVGGLAKARQYLALLEKLDDVLV